MPHKIVIMSVMLKMRSLNENLSKPPAMANTNPPIPNTVNKRHKIMSASMSFPIDPYRLCLFGHIHIQAVFLF